MSLAAAVGAVVSTSPTASAQVGAQITRSVAAVSTGSRATPHAQSPPHAWSHELFTGASHSFMGGSGTWAGYNAAIGAVAIPAAPDGEGALSVRNSTLGPTLTGAVSGLPGPGSGGDLMAAIPNAVYRTSAWVRASGLGRQTAAFLQFFTRDGSSLGVVWGQATADVSSAWVEESVSVALAPPSAAFVRAGEGFFGALPGEVHYVSDPSLQEASAITPPVVGPLRTSGNRILDGRGRVVVLRGLNRFGMESEPASRWPTKNEIDEAHLWGANFIRLSLGEQHWLAGGCQYSAAYIPAVDQVVKWITEQGMVVLLDLHENTPGTCGVDAQQHMADEVNSPTFWQQVASRYKSNPLVAFDLYNEPRGISDQVWLNGGWVSDGRNSFQAAGMSQLYRVVRSTGASNLVFMSGNNSASQFPKTAPVAGSNIVYAVHAYTCPETEPPQCANKSPFDAGPQLNPWVVPASRVPVAFDEFGWPGHHEGRFLQAGIAFAEAHGWSWSAFAWDGSDIGKFDLLSQFLPGPTSEPNPTGIPVLEGLVANRG